MKISLYLKIVFLLVFSWIFISISMWVVIEISMTDEDDSLWESRSGLIEELIENHIGDPPDEAKIRELSKAFNLEFTLSEQYKLNDDTGRPKGFHRVYEVGPYTVSFQPGRNNGRQYGMLLFILFLGIFFILLYFIIRKILKPIKDLQNVASQFSAGKLDIRIPGPGRDELGDLVKGFNSMAEDLERMLKNRDQLIMDVSHELRSPLARVKVALALLEEHPRMGVINNDLNEMEELTGRLLDFYRLGEDVFKLNMVKTDVGILLEQVMGSFDSSERIHCDSFTDPVFVNSDPFQLSRVIRNLIENGLRYSPEKGLTITLSQEGADVYFRFRDYGPGIPFGHQEDIFEPFFRLDGSRNRETGGFGIGLALSRRIAAAHGGELTVSNHPEGGAEFLLRLPVRV